MITIDYRTEYLEGEPGPNFYWLDTPNDFMNLVIELHALGQKNGIEKVLNNIQFVKVVGNYKIVTTSSVGGNLLCKVDKNTITINLDCTLWRLVLGVFLGISFYACHHYLDFEDFNLIEDANFIVSSEGESHSI